MKSLHYLRRREFLKTTTGTVGGVAVANVCLTKALSAESPPRPRSRTALDKLLGDLDVQGRQFMALPKPDQQFLNLMIQATRAKNALELGTAYGFSTLWMALALEVTGGKLTTLEILPDRVESARKRLAEAGVSSRVTCRLGDAHQLVAGLPGGFDFVFLNADKSGNLDYFKKLYPAKLLPGGLLLAYSAILSREKMKDYLDAITAQPDLDTVILSATMDDGFALSYRRRA